MVARRRRADAIDRVDRIDPSRSGAFGVRPRTGRAASRRLARAPLVRLLDHPEVDERLRLAHPVDRPQALGEEAEQALVVLADGLDQDVVRARR